MMFMFIESKTTGVITGARTATLPENMIPPDDIGISSTIVWSFCVITKLKYKSNVNNQHYYYVLHLTHDIENGCIPVFKYFC